MKKSVFIVLAAVLAFGMLTACSRGGKGNSGSISIRFATWDDAEDLDAQQALVDRFNSSNSNIKVAIEAYGDDFDAKIAASMGSKDAPDVMYMWNYPAYYGGLEVLDPYIEKEGKNFRSNYFEAVWTYNSISGKVYGMPVGFTTHVLYYNIDMFDKAGVSYPNESWTWNDLRNAARIITEYYNDGKTKGFVFPLEYDPYDYEMYLWANGTAFSDASGKIDGFVNGPAAVEVYTFFQNLLKDGYAVADEDGYGTSIIRNGSAAMYINGSWPISGLRDAGINFNVAPLPMFKPGQKAPSILSSSGLAMSVDSKNKGAAWEFIKFWTGTDANIARIDYELPVLISVTQSQNVESDPIKGMFYNMLRRSEGYTPASFIVDNWSQISDRILLAMEKMWNPTSYTDPQEAADAVVR